MEMSKWNALYNYNKQKYPFSKMENREAKQFLSGVGTSGSGEDIKKDFR
jgi:hypothetical protein